MDEVDDEVGRPATDERADDTQRHLNEQTQTIVYTVGQKKGTDFPLCAFFQYSTETSDFFHCIKDSISYIFARLILACIKHFG